MVTYLFSLVPCDWRSGTPPIDIWLRPIYLNVWRLAEYFDRQTHTRGRSFGEKWLCQHWGKMSLFDLCVCSVYAVHNTYVVGFLLLHLKVVMWHLSLLRSPDRTSTLLLRRRGGVPKSGQGFLVRAVANFHRKWYFATQLAITTGTRQRKQ